MEYKENVNIQLKTDSEVSHTLKIDWFVFNGNFSSI